MTAVLGVCLWCGHSLAYWNPGSPPGDCAAADLGIFYSHVNVRRSFALIDSPLDFGQFCPSAQGQPGQAIGQFGIHELELS
jgi:hypothetical protein